MGGAVEQLSSSVPSWRQIVESPDVEELLHALGRPDHGYIALAPLVGMLRMLLAQVGTLGLMSINGMSAGCWRSESTAGVLSIAVDLGSSPGARHNGQLVGTDDLILFSGAADRFQHRQQVHFRDGEQDGDRPRLGDDGEAVGVAGPDEVARVHLAQTQASGDRRLDAGVGELEACVLHPRAVGRGPGSLR